MIKNFLYMFFCCWTISSYSQEAKNIDSCIEKNKYPSACDNIDWSTVKIDTIKSKQFGQIVEDMFKKIDDKLLLTKEDDRILIKIVNTLEWANYFNQNNIRKDFPKTNLIKNSFDKWYKKILGCKYHICFGSGVSPYFIELQIQYLGNPLACDRYYILK